MTEFEEKALTDILKGGARGHGKQYQFDDYVVIRVMKKIKTKLGVAFDSHEYAIADPKVRHFVDIHGKQHTSIFVWSVSNRCLTSVPLRKVDLCGAKVEIVDDNV